MLLLLQAYYLMAEALKQDMGLKLSRAVWLELPKDDELAEPLLQPLKKLRSLMPSDTFAQQMRDMMDMEESMNGKIAVASEFVKAWVQGGGDLGLPKCITEFHA